MPEFWGKDSPYHPSTEFLGTPPDHLKVCVRERLSGNLSNLSAVCSDVCCCGMPAASCEEAGLPARLRAGRQRHALPVPCKCHLLNYEPSHGRGVVRRCAQLVLCAPHCPSETGLPLNPREASDTKSVAAGVTGVGLAALTVDLPSAVEALKSSTVLADAAKAVISFPLLYHYLGGVRHIYWDHANYGLQAEKKGPLTLGAVDRSSYAVLGASLVGTAGLALAWF